ncbi:hypothetical protein Bbelb_317780 [Branchiostoma belcheri]|nr:hypothetical protein Bbelb_317780 [Branchiostoma belcheri]
MSLALKETPGQINTPQLSIDNWISKFSGDDCGSQKGSGTGMLDQVRSQGDFAKRVKALLMAVFTIDEINNNTMGSDGLVDAGRLSALREQLAAMTPGEHVNPHGAAYMKKVHRIINARCRKIRRNRVYRAISGLLTYGLRRGPPGTYYIYDQDLLDIVRDTYPSSEDVNWMLTNQDNRPTKEHGEGDFYTEDTLDDDGLEPPDTSSAENDGFDVGEGETNGWLEDEDLRLFLSDTGSDTSSDQGDACYEERDIREDVDDEEEPEIWSGEAPTGEEFVAVDNSATGESDTPGAILTGGLSYVVNVVLF